MLSNLWIGNCGVRLDETEPSEKLHGLKATNGYTGHSAERFESRLSFFAIVIWILVLHRVLVSQQRNKKPSYCTSNFAEGLKVRGSSKR